MTDTIRLRKPNMPDGGGYPLYDPSAALSPLRRAHGMSKCQVARAGRWEARRKLRPVTTLPRLKHCGRTPISDVAIRRIAMPADSGQAASAGMCGLTTCGSTWSCPQCSAQIAEHRRNDLHDLLIGHRKTGGQFAMLTLTMRHRKNQGLKKLWSKLMDSWAYFQSGKNWRKARTLLTGYCRVVEVTHGKNGWHVHIHVILFFKPTVRTGEYSPIEWTLNRLRGEFTERWIAALARFGATADARHALDLKRLTGDPSDTLSEYFVKATYEMARADLKDARHGNRTPFAILRSFLTTGDLDTLELWQEFEQGSHGKRQWGFSKGLKAEYAVEELSDDEILAKEIDGETVILFDKTNEQFYALFNLHDVTELLEIAERADSVESARSKIIVRLTRWGFSSDLWYLPELLPPK